MNVERASSVSTPDFGALVARHRNYFLSGATRFCGHCIACLRPMRKVAKV
jgi:hypothetical protein